MEKKLLNLTLPVVIEEIEAILETYPKYPYQQAFSLTELRQDLIAYVLSRVPNKYTVVEGTETLEKSILSLPYPSKMLLDIEHYIHLGIRDILHIYNQDNCEMRLKSNLELHYLFSS